MNGHTLIPRDRDMGDTRDTVEKKIEEVERLQPPSSSSFIQNPGILELKDSYRAPAGQSPTRCLRCGRGYVWHVAKAEGLTVCFACHRQLILTATPEGRLVVENLLDQCVRRKYRHFEFEHFDRYSPGLQKAWASVRSWAKRTSEGQSAGSMYVYSVPDSHGNGCGNGKTSLLYAAYKYVARRTAYFVHDIKPVLEAREIDLRTFACDLKRVLIDPCLAFFRDRTRICIDPDNFAGIAPQCVDTYDDYKDYVALLGEDVPVLFLDDIGRGVKTGGFGAQQYEDILGERAERELPVFVTGNLTPDELCDFVGPRAASRIFRNNCEPLEIRALDYARVRNAGFRRPRGGVVR